MSTLTQNKTQTKAKQQKPKKRGFSIPSPLEIAVGLTFLTLVLACILTVPQDQSITGYIPEVLGFWQQGVWELLAFTMQMALILGLGYILALAPAAEKVINSLLRFCKTGSSAILLISISTLTVAFFNWGLGLVFGAIISRKMGEHLSRNNIPMNYPLMGAAAYTGMMVWHGGLSGSAPLKVAEEGHFLADKMGVIPISETVFSNMNLMASLVLLIAIPLFAWWLSRKHPSKIVAPAYFKISEEPKERPDYKLQPLAIIFGLLVCGSSIMMLVQSGEGFYKQINLNFINLFLFGLAVLLMGNFKRFLSTVDEAVASTSGIIIQFPLYAGIMGVMKYSGLMVLISEQMVAISTEMTFPVYTLFSAGLVNVFVPSGGGQWAVQGPIIVEAATKLGVDLPKAIMALSYGDQLTNMVQPFWALPLLGITGLKPKELLPYSLRFMGLGLLIFIIFLLLF
jgi:short-chain fatty acids transporter